MSNFRDLKSLKNVIINNDYRMSQTSKMKYKWIETMYTSVILWYTEVSTFRLNEDYRNDLSRKLATPNCNPSTPRMIPTWSVDYESDISDPIWIFRGVKKRFFLGETLTFGERNLFPSSNSSFENFVLDFAGRWGAKKTSQWFMGYSSI